MRLVATEMMSRQFGISLASIRMNVPLDDIRARFYATPAANIRHQPAYIYSAKYETYCTVQSSQASIFLSSEVLLSIVISSLCTVYRI